MTPLQSSLPRASMGKKRYPKGDCYLRPCSFRTVDPEKAFELCPQSRPR